MEWQRFTQADGLRLANWRRLTVDTAGRVWVVGQRFEIARLEDDRWVKRVDELRSQDWVPRLVRLKAHRLERAVQRLEASSGREANDYELAREMELSMQELSELKAEASPKTMFSLSEKLDDSDDDRDMEKVEIIEDKKGLDPVQALHQQDVLEVITSNLTKKERLIIIMYYYEGLTMREIGDIMSLTESRVCQIHSNVMSRLKAQLKALAMEGATL